MANITLHHSPSTKRDTQSSLSLAFQAPHPGAAGALESRHIYGEEPSSQFSLVTRSNVLLFGETGTGKSSLINMIAGHTVAGVSADAQGCTFGSTSYPVALSDTTHIAIWDTAGLNEGENGNVPPAQAMRNLQDLVGNMQGGISLLVYCIRASRFREIWKINYDLFVNIICQGQVRVVLVVTGLEDESPMEKWWEENGGEFSIHGMRFDDHACITSTRGKLKGGVHMYQEEFSESERETRRLILDNCKYQPWVMNRERWMRNIQVKMRAYYEQEARLAQQSRTPQPNAIAGSVERVEVRHGRERGQINAESILPAVLNLFATLLSIFLGPGAVRVR